MTNLPVPGTNVEMNKVDVLQLQFDRIMDSIEHLKNCLEEQICDGKIVRLALEQEKEAVSQCVFFFRFAQFKFTLHFHFKERAVEGAGVKRKLSVEDSPSNQQEVTLIKIKLYHFDSPMRRFICVKFQ